MTEEATTSATGTAVTAAPGQPAERREAQDQVTVRMPAEGAYLSVLRTATAGLAARLDFTLDEIEDLRIAVDEACATSALPFVPAAPASLVASLNSVWSCGYFSKCGGLK